MNCINNIPLHFENDDALKPILLPFRVLNYSRASWTYRVLGTEMLLIIMYLMQTEFCQRLLLTEVILYFQFENGVNILPILWSV